MGDPNDSFNRGLNSLRPSWSFRTGSPAWQGRMIAEHGVRLRNAAAAKPQVTPLTSKTAPPIASVRAASKIGEGINASFHQPSACEVESSDFSVRRFLSTEWWRYNSP